MFIKKRVYKHMKMCYNIDYIMYKVDNSEIKIEKTITS